MATVINRSDARQRALVVASEHNVDPFFYDPDMGLMYATGIGGCGHATYRPASEFPVSAR